MDFKKYLVRLGVEPRSEDPDFITATRASLDHARTYAEAQEFEDKLEAALRLPGDAQLKESILGQLGIQSGGSTGRSTGTWLALAASVLIAVGAASFLLPGGGVDASVRDAFVTHLDHPEPALTSRQAMSAELQLERFAQRGVVLREAVRDVTYFSPCVIGDVQGVHMVMTDAAEQQITFMLMPGQQLDNDQNFTKGDMTVRIAKTSAGAVALFGHQGQDLGGPIRDLLRNIDGPMRSIVAN